MEISVFFFDLQITAVYEVESINDTIDPPIISLINPSHPDVPQKLLVKNYKAPQSIGMIKAYSKNFKKGLTRPDVVLDEWNLEVSLMSID